MKTLSISLWGDKPRHGVNDDYELKRERGRMPWRTLCRGHFGIRVGPPLVKRDERCSLRY